MRTSHARRPLHTQCEFEQEKQNKESFRCEDSDDYDHKWEEKDEEEEEPVEAY